MLQIENTFFELGESCEQDCLIICDRGAMDAAACNIIQKLLNICIFLINTNENTNKIEKYFYIMT